MNLDQAANKIYEQFDGKLCKVEIGKRSPFSNFYFAWIVRINKRKADDLMGLYYYSIACLDRRIPFSCKPIKQRPTKRF